MALGNSTSHERYTSDANDQVEAVNELKRVYAELAEQQRLEYERVAAAQLEVTQGLSQSKASAGLSLGGLSRGHVALAAAVATAGMAVRSFNQETDRLDALAKGAVKSGLGVEAYQRLAHVAELSRTSIEAVTKASTRLELNMRVMADGGGKAAAGALKDLNLSADQLAKMPATERLALLADRLNGISNRGQRAAIAVELFGKSGQELLPMLEAGGAGIREMNDELGRTFTAAELARVEKYEDAKTRLTKATTDFKTELVIGLAPAMEEVTNVATMSAKGWQLMFGDWDENMRNAKRNLFGIREEAEKIGGLSLFTEHTKQIQDLVLGAKARAHVEEDNVALLEQQASWAEHALDLAIAQGLEGEALEDAYSKQYDTKIALLRATGDQIALERALRDETIRQAAAATATRRSRGGGRGPSDADRLRADGEAMLQQWNEQLRLAELTAELGGEAANEALYLGRVRTDLAIQELELSKQVLEATRAKNSVERQRNETAIASADAAIRVLELEQQLADKRAGQAQAQAWRNEWVASVQSEAQSLRQVVDLEDYRRGQRAEQLEAEGRLSEAYAVRVEQAQVRADQVAREFELRQQLILAEEPETEAERVHQQMALEALAHEQRMGILRAESDARRLHEREAKRLFEAERARKAAGYKQAVTLAEQGNLVAAESGELASFIAQQTIKDEEKRQGAILRVQGGILMALGAVEVAKAVAAYASLNIPQGLAHTAAAAVSFAKGGMMLAGQIPGGGGGGGGAPAAASAPREARERNTSDSGVSVPGSVPAADQGPRQVGGPGPATNGGTSITINNPNGSIDEDFAEKMAKAIKDSRNGSEAAA